MIIGPGFSRPGRGTDKMARPNGHEQGEKAGGWAGSTHSAESRFLPALLKTHPVNLLIRRLFFS